MQRRQWMYGLGLAVIAAVLTGCGGGNGVGDQKSEPPVAWAKVLNHPFQRNGDGSITLDVRAGSEVFLTGVDSSSTTLPVLRYQWQAGNAAAEDVRIVTRNVSTMSFTAPETAASLPLQFDLTVYDSDDVSDTTTVTVNVKPFRDINTFLQYDGPPTFKVVPVTSVAVPLAHSVPFTITVKRSITYRAYDGQLYTVPNGSTPHPEDFERTLTGNWSAVLGTGGTDEQCGDLEKNPTFELPVPAIDMDDVLETLSPSQADQQRAPDPSLIDSAQMEITLSIAAPTFDTENQGAPAAVGVCWVTADSAGARASAKVRVAKSSFGRSFAATSASTSVNVTELLGPANDSWDTLASAKAYYDTIDPAGSRDTFNKWLVVNGFAVDGGPTDWATLESRSGAHAVYLNNFDLGFGRDMYMRVKSCDGHVDVPPLGGSFSPGDLADLVGTCDIAGVVVNYASLEAAAKKIAPVLAVAMEYGTTPYSGGKRITTFYTYAPDRNREFKLVHSANLDGRGERYLPQACTVCHSGRTFGRETVDTGTGGDVDAAFMSWDLDSFLYSNTDPSFSNADDPDFTADEEALTAKYTPDLQEPAFKTMNKMAYLTYGEGDGRFDFARELVAGWYHEPQSASMFASAKFKGEFVPANWEDDAAYDGFTNPSDSSSVYHDVFARNCRACHVLQGSGQQGRAMGSYRDFIDSPFEELLEQGSMPFARLTADRFWVDKPGATSAADKLRQHLNPTSPADAFADAGKAAVVLAGFPAELVRDQTYLVDARQSLFLTSPSLWTLDTPPTPASATLEKLSDTQALLSGVSDSGTYAVRLTDGLGATGTLSAPRANLPIAVTSPSLNQNVPLSVGPAVPVSVAWTGGDGATRLANVASSDPSIVDVGSVTYTNGSGTIQLIPKLLGEAQISFQVIDADGDIKPHAFRVTTSLSIELTDAQGYSETSRRLGGAASSGLLKAAFNANAALLDLKDKVSPPVTPTSEPVTFQLVSAPAGTALTGTNVSYRPAVAYMTGYSLDGATPMRMATPTSIKYRVCYTFYAVAGQCPTDATKYAEADLSFEVVGRGLSAPTAAQREANSAGWQYVYDGIKTNCLGCHLGPSTDTFSPNWMGATDSTSSIFDSSCDAVADGTPATTGANEYIVKPGNSGDSNLYQKAQGAWLHRNVDPGTPFGDQDLWTGIRNWIDDGAYYTISQRTPQKCPARP